MSRILLVLTNMPTVKPHEPYPPSAYEYAEKTEQRNVFSFSENLRGDDDDLDDDGNEIVPIKVSPQIQLSEITLGWLLTLVPQGIRPDQIKMACGYHANSHAYEDYFVRFYYEVTIPERTAEFLAATQKHEDDLAQYQKDIVAYNEALRLERIAAAEAELARLKGR